MNESTSIVNQYVEAMNGHNIEKIRQLLHPKYSYTGGDGKRQEGIDAGIKVATMYMSAFPDMKLEVKNTHTLPAISLLPSSSQRAPNRAGFWM